MYWLLAMLFVFICLVIWFVQLLALTFGRRKTSPQAQQSRRQPLLTSWMAWVIFVVIFIMLLLLPKSVSPSREAAWRAACLNNLKRIGLATRQYYDANGHFPPAYTTDDQGRPLHSWRVLILPYMECDAIHERIRLDEPWNSAHNTAVFESVETPSIYRCPASLANEDQSDYVMIVGPGCMSKGATSVRKEDITDGTDNTIMVAESTASGFPWYEPRDLQIKDMSFKINDPDHKGLRSAHTKYNVVNVLFANGHVHTLAEDVAPETLKALMTIAGGENVEMFWEGH